MGGCETIPGFLPAAGSITGRCVFVDRCGNATERCRREVPALLDLGGRMTRCFYPERAPDLPVQRQVRRGPAPRAIAGDAAAALGRRRCCACATCPRLTRSPASALQAVHEVTLDLWRGETLGLVGESGSGKSSFAKLLLGLSSPDAGSRIDLAGEPLPPRADDRTLSQLKALQIVFQNPGSALNRSQTVRRLIGRSLRLVGLDGARARGAAARTGGLGAPDGAGISTKSRVSCPAA